MYYERGAKKILRFFREEFHKVRFQKIEERPRGGGEVRQRRRADLDDLRRVERQDAHAGGSGCGCSASVLCASLLPALQQGDLKRIIFMATGALMSVTSSQQGETIPGIAHCVELGGLV